MADPAGQWPTPRHARRMLVLQGCVQPGLKPNINAATARVLDRIGMSLVAEPTAGCCGALAHHLNDPDDGLAAMRRNIDAWIPHLDAGTEAIVMTASGCGVMVKDYDWLLRHDAVYAKNAVRVAAVTKNISEVLITEREALAKIPNSSQARLPKSASPTTPLVPCNTGKTSPTALKPCSCS